MFWLFSYWNRIGCLMMRARTIWTRWMVVKEKAPWEDQSQWMKNKAIYQLMKILQFYQKIQGVSLCPQWIFRLICEFGSQTSAHYLLLVAAIFDFETRGDWGELKVLSGSRGWVKVLPPSPCHLWLTLHLKVFGKPTVEGVYTKLDKVLAHPKLRPTLQAVVTIQFSLKLPIYPSLSQNKQLLLT